MWCPSPNKERRQYTTIQGKYWANGSTILPSRRRARFSRGCHEGPRLHADVHTTQVWCLAGHGGHQEDERNLDRTELLREAAELREAAILGARLLREHCGPWWKGDCGIIRNQERMDKKSTVSLRWSSECGLAAT